MFSNVRNDLKNSSSLEEVIMLPLTLPVTLSPEMKNAKEHSGDQLEIMDGCEDWKTTYYKKYLNIHLRNGQQVEKGCKQLFKPLVWNKTANLKNMEDMQHNLSNFVMGIIKCTVETDSISVKKKTLLNIDIKNIIMCCK